MVTRPEGRTVLWLVTAEKPEAEEDEDLFDHR